MSDNPDAKAATGLIDLGTITTVLIPLLYTAGWSYAYHYFSHFHLGLMGLNIPKEYLFLYSFWVIKDQFLLSICALLVTVLFYFTVQFCFRQAKTERDPPEQEETEVTRSHQLKNPNVFQTLGLILAPVFILVLFCGFYYLGDRTAVSLYQKQVQSDFSSYPRAKVWLTEKASKEAGAIAEEWSKGCYRLLLRNKDHLYIFYAGGYDEKIAVEIIPQSKVRSVRVLPIYASSEECD